MVVPHPGRPSHGRSNPLLTRRSGHCRLFDSDDNEDLLKELMKLSLI